MITALINYMGSDNRLFPDRPFISYDGIGFSTATSSNDLYNGGVDTDPRYYELSGTTNRPINRSITFTIREGITPAAVPEPATWTMMIGGMGLVGGAMRRTRSVRREFTAKRAGSVR